MKDRFIPVDMIKNDKYEVGYLDVSKLNLTELINLKEELIGSKVNSICSIDAIINREIGYSYDDNNVIKSIKRKKKKTKYPINKNRIYINKMYR